MTIETTNASGTIGIGHAIECMQEGHRVTRPGLDGWVCYMPPVIIPEALVNGRTKRFVPKGSLHVDGYYAMMTNTGLWRPGWVPSAEDLHAPWVVLPDDAGPAPGI